MSFSHGAISHICGITLQTGLAPSRGDLPTAALLALSYGGFVRFRLLFLGGRS